MLERLQYIKDYYHSGGKYFGSWTGPATYRNPSPQSWIRSFCSFIPMDHLILLEYGPNGGAWTHEVLQALLAHHMPYKVTLYLVGTRSEISLVERDVLYPLQLRIGEHSIPSNRHGAAKRADNLFTLFNIIPVYIPNEIDGFTESPVAIQSPHLIYSFNTLCYCDFPLAQEILRTFRDISDEGSILICNFSELSECHVTDFEHLLKENHLKTTKRPVTISLPHRLDGNSIVTIDTLHYYCVRSHLNSPHY